MKNGNSTPYSYALCNGYHTFPGSALMEAATASLMSAHAIAFGKSSAAGAAFYFSASRAGTRL